MSKICNPLNKNYKKSPNKYVCNEKTGRWVLKTGKIGTYILMLQSNLYKEMLYKTKEEYKLKIPILDKLKVSYETWGNKDNTAGTCFWHAISAALNIPIKKIASDIKQMTPDLPHFIKKDFKTKEKVAKHLQYYREREFGVNSPSFCIIPMVYKNTMVVIFSMEEITPGKLELQKILFLTSTPENKIENVIFLCDLIFLEQDAHIELMTINTDTISSNWTQKYTANIHKLLLTLHDTYL
jgi:hypothetical protein